MTAASTPGVGSLLLSSWTSPHRRWRHGEKETFEGAAK
ncbi:unnamed protein product, partial [Nippostrongylus brasiliensis]|uniref:Uncharacterized protein n=1 Tax=Nippostrongylus brasiliensis TaxID=27835 RepID=A0A0N4XQ13_NIPBR